MNRLVIRRRVLAVVALLTLGQSARGLDFHASGFGTASVSCFTNNSADFVINDQPQGAGRSNQCDGGTDSLLGGQLDAGWFKSLEIGVQVVGSRNENRDFLPALRVAQLRWFPSDALTIRIGRSPTPAFIYSESRQIRYAMPWVRPPLEVYGTLPTFSQDGVEFLYNQPFGNWQAEWHVGATQIHFDTPISNTHNTVPVNAYGGFVNLTLETSNTLLKFGYSYSETSFATPDIERLFSLLRSSHISQGGQLADHLAIADASTQLFSLGARHEYDDWLAISEFSYRTMQGFFRDQIGAYATLGRRFDSWMPYATIARRWSRGPNNDNRAGFLHPQVAALLTSTRYDTTSVGLGLVHDIHDNIKLKFQTDWIQPDNNSWGLYTNHSANYNYANPGGSWLFTLSMDFVF